MSESPKPHEVLRRERRMNRPLYRPLPGVIECVHVGEAAMLRIPMPLGSRFVCLTIDKECAGHFAMTDLLVGRGHLTLRVLNVSRYPRRFACVVDVET